jgi:hypothetical protein
MMIPAIIRDGIRDRLWATADELGWSTLPDTDRAKYYEIWTRDPTIGGQIGHFMDPRKVRVYIKDSLIKPYERARLSLNENDVWRLLSLPTPDLVSESFIKPHGRRLPDGRVVCWGRSRDWKLILMAVFERGRAHSRARAFGAVLLETGRTSEKNKRQLVLEAARRLGIEKLAWLE